MKRILGAAALLLLSVPLTAQAEPCTDEDLQSTWRVYTTPMDMGGTTCTTSCLIRIGSDNQVVPEVSNCVVTNSAGAVLWRDHVDVVDSTLRYNGSSGKENAERYAVVDWVWTFITPDGAEMTWVLQGEQARTWGKRKGMVSGAVNCRKKGKRQRAGSIHGNAAVFRDGLPVGQAGVQANWRSPMIHAPKTTR